MTDPRGRAVGLTNHVLALIGSFEVVTITTTNNTYRITKDGEMFTITDVSDTKVAEDLSEGDWWFVPLSFSYALVWTKGDHVTRTSKITDFGVKFE